MRVWKQATEVEGRDALIKGAIDPHRVVMTILIMIDAERKKEKKRKE